MLIRRQVDRVLTLGGRNAATRKVYDSYVAFRERAGAWSKISLKAVLEAREG